MTRLAPDQSASFTLEPVLRALKWLNLGGRSLKGQVYIPEGKSR